MQIYLRFPEAPQFLPELQVYIKLVDGEEETSLKTDHEYADLSSRKPAQGRERRLDCEATVAAASAQRHRWELLFLTNFHAGFPQKQEAQCCIGI